MASLLPVNSHHRVMIHSTQMTVIFHVNHRDLNNIHSPTKVQKFETV